jgi:class 3 adenylate cyclase/tetratricopeptide (TPR) repeat protein
MDLLKVLDQVRELLHRKGRITYRMLKAQFQLDDDAIDTVREELIVGERVAADEDGKVLVWIGEQQVVSAQLSVVSPQHPAPNTQSPISYTPPHLADRIRATSVTDGERKSITALFADIKGSTDLIADLDPEEARAILDPTLQLMMDAVHRYEGYVAQSLGDGIFALFGAPIAHEDHPQRALYAALLMQEESRKRAEHLRSDKGVNVQIRVGINTGEVVLRSIRKDDLHTDYVPVGQSTHLASRMESLATPGSILVSEQTYKLTEGYFAFKPLGHAQVKGFAEKLAIYEVVGVGPLRTKLQLSVKRGLARFIGRQHEMALLQHVLEQAKAGHGQIAGVMGEPGVGKSRLFYEFKLLSQRGCLVLETFSVSHGKAYPYLPLIDLLKNYFQLTTQDDERRRREKITGKVLTLDRSLEDTLPYLFFLLGIAEATSPLQQMDAQIRRKRILEAIKRLLLRESLNQPLIIIFEDLHWLDAETQAFLQLLSDSVATARILLLVNYRPEYQSPWHGKTYFSQLRLDPLGKEQAEEMLTVLLDDAAEFPLPRRERARVRGSNESLEPLKKFILAKTEGNPFFMEEIVQELREQGVLNDPRRVGTAHQYSDLRLPTTVQGVLSARMDRLSSEEKSLLQTLAVIGREFSSSLLRKVVTEHDEELLRLLSRLQSAEFVYEQPAFPEVEYIFKHALTQEVAYNSLLIERRKVLHERTAQAIEEVYRLRLEDHYSELAYHYSRSGNTQKAVDYLQLAGQQAIQRSAYVEATNHLTAALELLKTLPEALQRGEQELALLLAFGLALMATKGESALEVEQVYSRAQELCKQTNATLQMFPVTWRLWAVRLLRAELNAARELGTHLLTLAHDQQDSDSLIEAHFALGDTLWWLAETSLARTHLEQAIASYDSQQHRSHVFNYGQDPRVFSLSYASWVLWWLGFPDQALARAQDSLVLARELAHPYSINLALTWFAGLHYFRRDEQAALDQADAAIALSQEHGFLQLGAMTKTTRGWALAEQGRREEGMEQLRQSVEESEVIGAALVRIWALHHLIEVCKNAGQAEEGSTLLTEIMALVNRTGLRYYEAELYRLKGELTLQKLSVVSSQLSVPSPQSRTPNPQAEAEECFLKAIEVARKQHAKSLELRATMSLARLWQQQGKRAEGHKLLSDVHNWFTEGFDTKDLQEAKALLNELSQ